MPLILEARTCSTRWYPELVTPFHKLHCKHLIYKISTCTYTFTSTYCHVLIFGCNRHVCVWYSDEYCFSPHQSLNSSYEQEKKTITLQKYHGLHFIRQNRKQTFLNILIVYLTCCPILEIWGRRNSPSVPLEKVWISPTSWTTVMSSWAHWHM